MDTLPEFDSDKVQSRFMAEMEAATFNNREELREANEVVGEMVKKFKEPPKTRPPIMPRRSFYDPDDDEFSNCTDSTEHTGSENEMEERRKTSEEMKGHLKKAMGIVNSAYSQIHAREEEAARKKVWRESSVLQKAAAVSKVGKSENERKTKVIRLAETQREGFIQDMAKEVWEFSLV